MKKIINFSELEIISKKFQKIKKKNCFMSWCL